MPCGTSPIPSASVLCLGTGDGRACGDRNHSSHLHRLGRKEILIDCGESVCRSLKARRYDFDRIDAILLSHTHADHIGGFFMLVQGMWLQGRKRPLPVYVPRHAILPLRQMLEHGYLFQLLIGFSVDFIPLKDGESFKIGAVRVTPHLTTHLDALKKAFGPDHRVGFESFAFLLETRGARVAHSADLGAPEDLDPLLRKPVQLLVCELAHFTPDALFRYLADKPVETAALVHLSRKLRRDPAALKARAVKALPEVRCLVPCDGEKIAL